MNLATVITELGAAAAAIPGLRVMPWAAASASPPAVLFGLPESISPNETYGRGKMKITGLPAIVLVGRSSSRTALADLALYCAGSGPKSLIAAWQNYGAYNAIEAINIGLIEPDYYELAGTGYLGATFHLDIVGSGLT